MQAHSRRRSVIFPRSSSSDGDLLSAVSASRSSGLKKKYSTSVRVIFTSGSAVLFAASSSQIHHFSFHPFATELRITVSSLLLRALWRLHETARLEGLCFLICALPHGDNRSRKFQLVSLQPEFFSDFLRFRISSLSVVQRV